MDKFWNMTVNFLSKVNTMIPLDAVLWAGVGLIGIVLILAITGCVLRKRLVPNWLIWTYFIFASMVIFAQSGNNMSTVVANLEIPFLAVLISYVLRLAFYRRPRYTYTTRSVTVREIDRTRPVKEVVEIKSDAVVEAVNPVTATEDDSLEVSTEIIEEQKDENEVDETVNNESESESESEAEAKAEDEDEVEVETNAETEADKTATETVKEDDKVVEEKVEEKPAELPAVEPIPAKAEPVVEPVVEPVRPATRPMSSSFSTIGSAFGARPTATTSSTTVASRPTTTTTSATTRPLSSYSSLYGSRLSGTTTTRPTTTVSRTTTSSTTSNISATRPTGLGTANAKTPRSTDDIMAAIERLRASMKK